MSTAPLPIFPKNQIYFQDSFESGSFSSSWVQPTSDGWSTELPYIASSPARGSYSYGQHFVTVSPVTNEDRALLKNFTVAEGFSSGVNPIYVRGYLQGHLNSGGADTSLVQRKYIFFKQSSGGTWDWAFVLTSDGRYLRMQNSLGNTGNPCGVPAVYSYDHNQSIPSGRYMNPPQLQWDTWYCIEIALGLNTPTFSDGWVKLWVDGTLYGDFTGLNIRGNCSGGWQRIEIGFSVDTTASGGDADENRYWDDVVMANSQIGL